jgi:hypothetical protein
MLFRHFGRVRTWIYAVAHLSILIVGDIPARCGAVKGKRDADVAGVVFFSRLDLTGNGTKETIRRVREKEEKEKPPRSFESIVRDIHKKRAEDKTSKD